MRDHHFDAVYAAYLGDEEGASLPRHDNNPAALRDDGGAASRRIERGLWRPRSNSGLARYLQNLQLAGGRAGKQ